MKITVIGGGPGGYVAALQAAMLGGDVTLVEKQSVGGTCLNRGCIPTKALLAGSDTLQTVRTAKAFGIHVEGVPQADYGFIADRKDRVVGQLVGGVQFLLKRRGVKMVSGIAKLVRANCVEVTKADGTVEVLDTEKLILATGSVPVVPSVFPCDGKQVFTSNEALTAKELPASIIIVGGGVIGCEFAQFYARMGVQVTVIEMAKHILPPEDEDVAAVLRKSLQAEGVDVRENVGVLRVESTPKGVIADLTDGDSARANCMLVSVGRRAYVDGLGLEAVGVATENGKITVDTHMQTSVPGIYAIGDAANTIPLAHVASREGVVAAQNAMGLNKAVAYHAIPRCIYTEPEVTGVGLTEQEAKARNIAYGKGVFRFAGIGKALVAGKTEGFVKVLTDEQDRIIGASIVGPHATDLIGEMTVLVHAGITAEMAAEIIHPHPSFSEALMEAIHDVHGRSVHSY